MRKIGNYSVEEIPIGSGGMGRVLRGVSPDGSRPVAIKEILPAFVSDMEYRSRIESEIAFLKKLDNDNVVKVYDHFEAGGNLYIVMELVEGRNIEQYVADNGPMAWTDAAECMIKLLRTMQYVHEHGIVHRDIKPGNIMIRPDGNIRLLDFGVAKDVSKSSTGGTVVGTVIGTDGYMSPEQAQGMSIDHRSDIYALGCVLYFMLTGSHAFTASSDFEMERDITTKPFPRLADRVRGVPSSVQEVIDHAVDKNMMKRYQSCREFADQLVRVLPGGTQINTAMDSGSRSISIGRENCDICIGADNFKVSRHHADIKLRQFTGGAFYVYTDCSSNGTSVNGQMIRKGMSYNIPKGDRPEILLAGDPSCRLDMGEVERLLSPAEESGAGAADSRKTDSRKADRLRERFTLGARIEKKDPSTFVGAVSECFRRYACFAGRSTRSEYWWFVIFNVMVSTLISLGWIISEFKPEMYLILLLWSLATLLPSLAVMIRRLHDVGKGWTQFLLTLIPVAGFFFSVYLIVLLARKGDSGANAYGDPPV
ncbi:MAG: protein kinase [Muribaculaceae bacterium]|nr:protein kinase [Muribaculaceae bacterium]